MFCLRKRDQLIDDGEGRPRRRETARERDMVVCGEAKAITSECSLGLLLIC